MHSTSGFDLNPGRGYNFKCNLCNGQVYWIPTLDTSVAIRWISENHLPRVHGITPSNTAPASSSGGWKEIQHEAFKDMIDAQRDRDFRTRNQARNVFITATIMQPVSDLIRDSIYEFFNPTAAGPTPQEQARRRLESSQRYYREQNARSDFQLLQEMTLARSRAMREAEMDADRERSDRLSGAFDVFRSRRSNSFFGIEGNPSDEQVAAALSEDAGADPFRPFFDGTRPSDAAPGGTLGAFESQLRGDSVPFAEDPSVVVFDTDVLRAKVDPKFLADQARRAEATDQYWRSQAKGDFHGPPTGPPSPDLEQIGLALVDRGLKGERDSLIGLARSGLPTEA
ncbi:MAG TPA: hypothetical protein VMU54_12720, partial [Planctomycetota bacterium]|nr:hypothetical protein [Planctomycetota bacterium]